MREIKSKGKRLDNGEWVVGYPIPYGSKMDKWAIYPRLGASGHIIDPATLGMFTGAEGRYVGDVIIDRADKAPVIIEWDKVGFKFVVTELNGDYADDFAGWEDCELIGNIHDNPELVTT